MKAHSSIFCLFIVTSLVAIGCHLPGSHNTPPMERLVAPGPGVGGPGPGVLAPMVPPMMMPQVPSISQVLFSKPDGTKIHWDTTGDGKYDSVPLIVPGRHNFPQGGIYRLKLTNIPAREGEELYPTLEIGPATARSDAFLAHNAIPIQFTEDDFDQVLSGNFVTKVIYLPNAEDQELALAGVGTLVSTRLVPGVDPIEEADRRGAILAILRFGNKNMEMAGSEAHHVAMIPAAYSMADHGAGGATTMHVSGGSMPPSYVAGVTTSAYGMPMSGTPIGLPGPPHIPLGVPAGLRKHVIKNHTRMNLPRPTKNFRIDVRQQPGMSYPQPVNRVRIVEQNIHPSLNFRQPLGNQFQLAD